MKEELSPLGRSILQRVAQAGLGATAGLVSAITRTYHSQYRWFPTEGFVCLPRPWLAGVGSSLEPLLANAWDGAGGLILFSAFLAATVPTRLSLKAQAVGALVVLVTVMAPLFMTLNHWHWSGPEVVERCSGARG